MSQNDSKAARRRRNRERRRREEAEARARRNDYVSEITLDPVDDVDSVFEIMKEIIPDLERSHVEKACTGSAPLYRRYNKDLSTSVEVMMEVIAAIRENGLRGWYRKTKNGKPNAEVRLGQRHAEA